MEQRALGQLRDRLSVRTELLLLVLGVSLALSLLVLGYFPAQFDRESRRASEQTGELLATIAHHAVEPGFEFDDAAFMEESLQVLSAYQDVDYVVVRGGKGELLVSLPSGMDSKPLLDPGTKDAPSTRREGGQLHIQLPLRAGDGRVGSVQLGLSELSLEAQGRLNRLSSAGVMALSVLACAVLAAVLGSKMLAPLLGMAQAARLLEQGDWEQAESCLVLDGARDTQNEVQSLNQGFRRMLLALHEQEEQLQLQKERLQVALKNAEAATEAKGIFLANMSHEIRTPMSGVLGMVELMLEDDLSPEHRANLLIVRQSGQALVHVINDVLDFSKLEAGKLQLEQSVFSPEELVRTVHGLLAQDAARRGLEFRVELLNLPSHLLGDAFRLRQILMNLLSNALKFTASGHVLLRIEALPLAPGQVSLLLQVQDTGIGIGPEAMGQLFQSFHQADNSTTRRYGGTGLGLSISRQLAELLGGSLTASSVVGKGSTFSLQLPVQTAASPTVEPRAHTRQELQGLVLVVDDNAVNRLVARRMLERHGLEVVTACDGLEALEVLEAEQGIELVLMDCQMPVLDGFQATLRLRELGCRTPIVALSANVLQEARARCLEVGMQDFLNKPIDAAELDRVLGDYLSAPSVEALG